MPDSSSPIPAVFETRPAAARMSLPSIFCSPDGAHGQADAVARSALDIEASRLEEKLNPFSPQNSAHFIDDVGILAGHQLRPGLDHGHAAAEAAISLRQFEADIAAAEHHQMRGCIVEFERLDMGQRPGGFEAGNRGN
jgi:hypothetical protein